MKEVDQNDVRSIFTELIDHPPDQRRSILDSTCGNDEVLRKRVLRLLEAHERENGVLEASASDYLDDEFQALDAPTTTPERIGEFDITRLIAAGGMGLVYEACQEFPRRQVAIKLLRRHLGSRSAYHRFREEAHILARLRHPAVAQIYAASVHKVDGESLPYLVMEYVADALPITKYADEKELTVEERLQLFIEVCEGVHHGHQKGVIHRDLKPDNILVDSNAQPKVVDFGVARVTDSDVALVTKRTTTGQLVGTLQYMSPEQLSTDADEIDTRSDVYSLGAVLYELLAGQPPIDIRELTIPEALRKLNEESAAPLRRHVPGISRDLELIVRKAIDRDPARRYQTVEALQQDLQRYLEGEAIWARPLTITYKLRIGIRQHRLAAVAAFAFLFVVVASVIGLSALYLQAEKARKEAAAEREGVVDTRRILASMLTAVAPASPDDAIAYSEILDAGTRMIEDGDFGAHPLNEAVLRRILADAYISQRLYVKAHSHLKAIVLLNENELGPEARETLQAKIDVINNVYSAGVVEK